jgi:murein DD-endopeptidase MepM/ murein hydrolase activator NlpD
MPYLRGLGFASNAMRYSYDFVRVDIAGKSDALSMGDSVYAVENGTVVRVVENQPDDGSFDPETSRKDINALFGNYVVVDLGAEVFALYGHLQQDSVTVEPGQRVRRGQAIARVGRSGSAEFPHLHFQLMDGPDMHAEGVPVLFEHFVRVRGSENAGVGRGAIGTGDIVESRDH